MYLPRGLGDVPPCSSITVDPAFVGPVNCAGLQSEIVRGDLPSGADNTTAAALAAAMAAAGNSLMPTKGAGVLGWLNTGNNAIWVGGGVLAVSLFLMASGGGRR